MRSKIREALEQGFIKLQEGPLPAPDNSDSDKLGDRPPNRAALNRHRRKCTVCRHPRRAEIEQDFLQWISPDQIALQYSIGDHSTIYRHAHATGLYERRTRRIQLALAPIIEQAGSVQVNARSVINAVYVFAHLDSRGRWTHARANRQSPRLEPNANYSK